MVSGAHEMVVVAEANLYQTSDNACKILECIVIFKTLDSFGLPADSDRGQQLRMDRIDDIPHRVEENLGAFLNAPEADLADPLRVGGFGGGVVGEGGVDLVGDRGHKAS